MDLGRCAIVRFLFAAAAAFLILPRAAAFCFADAIESPLMALKKLHRALMRLGLRQCGEGAKIAPSAGLRILFARVQAVLTRFQPANHSALPPSLGAQGLTRKMLYAGAKWPEIIFGLWVCELPTSVT